MKKEELERYLAEGLSLDRMGELTGKHPSTVSYHLKKHGLTPVGHEAHAPNGRLRPDELRRMVDEGFSIRSIAAATGTSYSTVRHWIKRLGLETRRGRSRRENLEARRQGLPERLQRECAVHGRTEFFLRSDRSSYRCVKCAAGLVSRRRREIKLQLVREAGGCCALCGYARNVAALHFHHLDPELKSFGLSRGGRTRSIQAARDEAAKCVLLCSNCHAEVEAGQVDVASELDAKVSRAA